MSDSMFSGWGIRTLGADELAYDPDDYQVGAVWPHDNAIVHAGLKRYGFDAEAERLFTAIFEAALAQPDARLPELFAGHSRAEQPTPLPYPDACVPQAWAAGALPFMLLTMLGLHPDAPRQELHLIRPRLPRWLRRVVVRDLRIGSAVADLGFVRSGNATRVVILRQEGPLHIRIFPAR
jgi:glycogen debranching enzyme